MAIAAPVALRSEYLTNPLGIDVRQPRLSWRLIGSERQEFPTACQILVADQEKLLATGQGNLWDSGKVVAPELSQVVYAGASLRSRTRYFWCVRVWDTQDQPTPYSMTAFFETGLLDAGDWQAQWIRPAQPRQFQSNATILLGKDMAEYAQICAVYLRQEFNLAKPVRQARAYVSGLGVFEFRLNGAKVGDRVLEPGLTDFKQRAFYVTYDVTAGLQAKNAVGIMLGNGMHLKKFEFDLPKLIFQLEIEFTDGSATRILSDESWLTASGPLQENGIYYGERYDARLEMPGWDLPDFNASAWEKATQAPGVPLVAQSLPPIRITQELVPKQLYRAPNGSYIFDFGQNFTGWVQLRVAGPRGTEVTLRFTELVREDGRANFAANNNAEATDVYILKGAGQEIYEPRFTYHGFRYVEMHGFPGVPNLNSLRGCFLHSDVESAGDFYCSQPVINQIHQNIRWGQLSNLMSIPTDCPQRDERQGWLGDAALSAEEAILNFDMAAFYDSFLREIQLAQQADGSLPDVVPPYWRQLYPADPAWSTAYLTLAWWLYWYYGDRTVLERHYLNFKKYIAFLQSQADNHLLKTLGKYGDWCPPGSVVSKKTPLELTSTWYYYHDVQLLTQIAAVLNQTADFDYYTKLAAAIKTAFNAAFLAGDEYQTIKLCRHDNYPSQTSNVLPLFLNLVPAEKRAAIIQKLLHSVIDRQDYHVDTGILGTCYLLDVLTDAGHLELAYKVATQTSYPGWGYMVKEGATTLWERWEKLGGKSMNSQNHIMFGSIAAWFYRRLAGVSCLAPGWGRIRVQPGLIPELDFVTCTLQTMRGEIQVAWEQQPDRFSLTVKVPVGAQAEIFLPELGANLQIYEGQTLLCSEQQTSITSAEIRFLHRTEKWRVYEVGSGFYQFRVTPGINFE